MKDTRDEITFLWRAIDLLVQEIGPSVHTSQWFRDQWEKLVIERAAGSTPEEPGR